MCDYSLHNVKTRPAKVGDKLTTRFFQSGTRGFCAPEDASVAVCVMPGTELSFDKMSGVNVCGPGIRRSSTGLRSSDRSTKKSHPPITTRWNSQMGQSCF